MDKKKTDMTFGEYTERAAIDESLDTPYRRLCTLIGRQLIEQGKSDESLVSLAKGLYSTSHKLCK